MPPPLTFAELSKAVSTSTEASAYFVSIITKLFRNVSPTTLVNIIDAVRKTGILKGSSLELLSLGNSLFDSSQCANSPSLTCSDYVQESVKVYKAISHMDSYLDHVYHQLGRAYTSLQDENTAIKMYHTALSHNPKLYISVGFILCA